MTQIGLTFYFSFSNRPNLEIMAILIRNGLVKGNYFFALEMLRGMNKRDIQPDEQLLALLEESRARARSLILKEVGNKSNISRRNMSLAGKYMVAEI